MPARSVAQSRGYLLFATFLTGVVCLLPACYSLENSVNPTHTQPHIPKPVHLYIEVNEDYSCPFLYCWDGSKYRLENDIYSVARGQSREYTDYLFISNPVVERGGQYIFEIREREGEQSWTDYLGLMVIDHPVGTQIATDSLGRIHSYQELISPSSAVNEDGIDVADLVSAKDNNAVSLHHAESILLDFSSVDISRGAKLYLRIQGFEGSLTRNYIPEVPAIRIQTMENGLWITRHQFFPKDFWAECIFDLGVDMAESQIVRLESVSCDLGKYHLIDMAGLDTSVDQLETITLKPASALMNGTIECLNEVSHIDRSYMFMDVGYTLAVTFTEPKPVPDSIRSFVFISRGYYQATGHTFYVYTWNGVEWVQRFEFEPNDYMVDTVADYQLGQFLPDTDGEYKIRVEHRQAAGTMLSAIGNLDWIHLIVNGEKHLPYFARDGEGQDILPQVLHDDNVYWHATNNWAIFKFDIR